MNVNLGDITFGVSNVFEGPKDADESRKKTINAHNVVRGKKPLQSAGLENDRRSYAFFFDETFCDVSAQKAKLEAAHTSGNALPLTEGHIYSGKHFVVESLKIKFLKTDGSGRAVRLEGKISLIEGQASGLGSAIGVAISAVAALNPLLRR